MPQVSYRDNNYELCDAAVCRDYGKLRKCILNEKDSITEIIEHNQELFGYYLSINQPLSNLYGSNFYVVKFVFSSVDTMHEPAIEELLISLMKRLKSYISSHKGYYNIRLASHIVDLLKAYNAVFKEGYFCGGTVEEFVHNKSVEFKLKDGMNLFFCDAGYVEKNKKTLLEITYASFKAYQGQYHISPVTEEKAGIIYRNWIGSDFDLFVPNTILAAEYNGVPCGFVTICEGDMYVEGKLAAVSDQYRGLGTYKNMIAYLINYANTRQKAFLSSTQFDNLTVQGAWASLGLKPFYSIYNFHIDAR